MTHVSVEPFLLGVVVLASTAWDFHASYSDRSYLGLPSVVVRSDLGLPSLFVRSDLGLPSVVVRSDLGLPSLVVRSDLGRPSLVVRSDLGRPRWSFVLALVFSNHVQRSFSFTHRQGS